jgi:glycosyltransferase involved in cell wall biosynthesis
MLVGSWPGAVNGNPFLEVLAASLEKLGAGFIPVGKPSDGVVADADVLLMQWPDQIFWSAPSGSAPYTAAVSEIKALQKWRRYGKKLVWIVHNAIPHDLNKQQRRLWSYYSWALSALSHGYMTLSPATQSTVLRHYPILRTKSGSSFRHPAYPYVTRALGEAVCRREQLSIPAGAYVIGALGRVVHYKRLPELVNAFRALADENIFLLICGRPKSVEARKQVERAAANNSRIRLCFDLLSHEEFALTAAACDAFVAPYLQYLHSGTLVYLACAERRSLTPNTPFAEDLAKCVGTSWITLYDGDLTPGLLRDFIDRAPPQERPVLAALDPMLAAQKILTFIRTL